MTPFEYLRPTSVAEAEKALAGDDEALLLAGGMTLLPTLKMRLAQPSTLIDLGAIDGLRGIRETNQGVEVGALTTHAEVAASDLLHNVLPALSDTARHIGDPQVRNRGTLGGSLANSDPAADYPAAVLGLGATVITQRREIPADEFFVDMFETALEPAEIITAVRFPLPRAAAYAKFANPASRYAVAGVMVVKTAAGVRVAVTGAASCVFRASAMETALDQRFVADALDGVAVDASQFNSDMHASQEYRGHLVKVMAQRAVLAAGA